MRRSTAGGTTFARFALVGGVMAGVDAAGLYAIHALCPVGLRAARLGSLALAMTVGYFLNRRFTFAGNRRARRVLPQLLSFYSAHATGGALNLALFALVLHAGRGVAAAVPAGPMLLPLCAVLVGGAGGISVNFVLSSRLVFRPWR